MRGASRTASVHSCRTRRVQTSRRSPALLVTLRLAPHVWNLRSRRCFGAIEESIREARERFGFRVIEFAILGNHLHLLVEADSSEELSHGIKGLCVRLAKALNTVMQRSGTVFADHYHSRVLGSPAEIVAALNYILTNAEHHYGEEGIDRFSSFSSAPEQRARVLGKPRGWLLSVGWRRAHRIPDCLTSRVQLGAPGIAEAESPYGLATMLERGLIRETFSDVHTLSRTTRWYSSRPRCA